MRITKTIRHKIIIYVREYAERVNKSANPINTLNSFNPKTAANAVIAAMKKKEEFTEKENETIKSEEFYHYLIDFFDEKLPVNYLVLKRDMGYYEAESLLKDKGVNFFPELKGLKSDLYKEKNNDYPATDKQIQSIVKFGVELEHANELSGREASLIISCLLNPKKTRPAYFTYYIKKIERPVLEKTKIQIRNT